MRKSHDLELHTCIKGLITNLTGCWKMHKKLNPMQRLQSYKGKRETHGDTFKNEAWL